MNYFDANATTPLSAEAQDAWIASNEALWLNPSAPYRSARRVEAALASARAVVADHFDVDPQRIVFTSGATEGNNACFAYRRRVDVDENAFVVTGATEHSSVSNAAQLHWSDKQHVILSCDQEGVPDLAALQKVLEERSVALCAVMAANNETGVIAPWQAVAQLCQRSKVPYLCDASQWVGKMPLNDLSACDFVTACGHKFGGPKGVGFMLVPEAITDSLLFAGGGQEGGLRSGTEAVALVEAMVAALTESETQRKTCEAMPNRFFEIVRTGCPEMIWVGQGAERLRNTQMVIPPICKSERWVAQLERRGFLVGSGSACSSRNTSGSRVLRAMGYTQQQAERAIRLSSLPQTTAEAWCALGEAIVDTHRYLVADAKSGSATVISID